MRTKIPTEEGEAVCDLHTEEESTLRPEIYLLLLLSKDEARARSTGGLKLAPLLFPLWSAISIMAID